MRSLYIDGVPVKICCQAISAKCLRLAILPLAESVREVFTTIDLAERDWPEPTLAISEVSDQAEYPISYTDGSGVSHLFMLAIDPNDFTLKVCKDGILIQTLTICKETGAVAFPLGLGPLFGLGHGFTQHLDRRGASYDLQTNGLVRGIFESYAATSPTPLVISTEGWALYFHQPWKADIHLRGDLGSFSKKPLEPLPYLDIFVIEAETPQDATKEYYNFTGLPPLPPKYAFGYQQSYRTLVHNETNYVLKTAHYMRDHEIPCDMLIYLGTGYAGYGWNVQNGNFAFNPQVFPEPDKTMQELHDLHYKVNLHITRCYTGLHGSLSDEDVSPLEYDHVRNYWQKHVKLYAQAKNECWWPDDADEVDIVARLTRWRMYYEGSLQLNPDTRPFQMQRNTFPGANKWGGIIWSGDIISEWETLRNQVPIGLNVSLSCSPYWGSDTGGFYSNAEFDGELFIRWFQYSIFTPFVRSHGRPSFLRNLWGWTMFTSLDEMPLELAPGVLRNAPPSPEILPDQRVQPICKELLNLRYQLLPYIYTLAWQTRQGIPMMRPMWYYYPRDQVAKSLGDQYFFGESLMVAPVTCKGETTHRVYFPEGTFYSLWTGECMEGGGYRDVAVDLQTIPVFVPAGGIITRGPLRQYIDSTPTDDLDPLTVEVYTGKDGCYTLYEDDGISQRYLQGECTMTHFHWNDIENSLSAQGSSTVFAGRKREIMVKLMPEGRSFSCTVTYLDAEKTC